MTAKSRHVIKHAARMKRLLSIAMKCFRIARKTATHDKQDQQEAHI